MAEFPALTLWTDAYLADTRHLSTVEHGAYLLLLMEAWRRPHCDLPDDDKILSRLAGLSVPEWVDIKDAVLAFWKRDGRSQTWSQKRLSLERGRAEKRSGSARGNAAKRWNRTKKVDATAMPNACQNDATTATAINLIEEDTDVSSTPIVPKHENLDLLGDADPPPAKPSPKPKPKVKPTEHVARPAEVDEQVWRDWLVVRNRKKAFVTETALKGVRREAEKAGWSLNDAIAKCAEKTWQGFEAEWVERRNGNGNETSGRGFARDHRNGSGRGGNSGASVFMDRAREARLRERAGQADGPDDRETGGFGVGRDSGPRALPGK